MPVVIVIAIILFIVFAAKGKVSNLSKNMRVGIFSLIIGIIFKFVSFALGGSTGYGTQSPLASLTSLVSYAAFFITICCLIYALYNFLFNNQNQ